MKKEYTEPEFDLLVLQNTDTIVCSTDNESGETTVPGEEGW